MAFYRSTKQEGKVIGDPIYLIKDGKINVNYVKGGLVTVSTNQTDGALYVNAKWGTGSVTSKYLFFDINMRQYFNQNKFIILKSKHTQGNNLVFVRGSSINDKPSSIASARSFSIVGSKVDSAYPYDITAVSVDGFLEVANTYFGLYGQDGTTARLYELAIVDSNYINS